MLEATVPRSKSMAETQSLLPLETKTYRSLAARELGLAPPTAGIPSTISPTRKPVLTLWLMRGGSSRAIRQTENASEALGSPRPGRGCRCDSRSPSLPFRSRKPEILRPVLVECWDRRFGFSCIRTFPRWRRKRRLRRVTARLRRDSDRWVRCEGSPSSSYR